jgi:hypothetical protein
MRVNGQMFREMKALLFLPFHLILAQELPEEA